MTVLKGPYRPFAPPGNVGRPCGIAMDECEIRARIEDGLDGWLAEAVGGDLDCEILSAIELLLKAGHEPAARRIMDAVVKRLVAKQQENSEEKIHYERS